MFARLWPFIRSGLGCGIGIVPGVPYYMTDLAGPIPSFVLIVLGGFIGLALTLSGVSARRVIHGAAQATPLLIPLAALVGPPEEPTEKVPPDGKPILEPVPDGPDPHWLTVTVVGLAEAIRADGANDRLPILADALEEAGCDNVTILQHCRDPEQVEGSSWVVELLLQGRRTNETLREME